MTMLISRSEGRISEVRMFLREDTPEKLVLSQLRTNVFLKGRADFTDFSFDGKQWICWFLVDLKQNPNFLEQVSADTQ